MRRLVTVEFHLFRLGFLFLFCNEQIDREMHVNSGTHSFGSDGIVSKQHVDRADNILSYWQ